MSTCNNVVVTVEIECKNAGSKLDYECTNWTDSAVTSCQQWADEGSNQCTSWDKCHWYTPWDCIAGFFCRAWYWVAKWVCVVAVTIFKWICKAFAWVVVHIFCGILVWIGLFVLSLLCLAFTQLKCWYVAFIKWWLSLFGDKFGEPRIQHVFVLYLENRAFDHILGFSGIFQGIDPSGQPTTFNDGFAPGGMTNNVDPRTHLALPTSSPAEYYLSGIDPDPGHEFTPTMTCLCGQAGQQTYNSATGTYPPIDNSGFVYNYNSNSSTQDPTRVMHCFDRSQLRIINQLARDFAVCDQWFSSMPGPTEPNRLFAMAASSGGLDDSPTMEWLQIAVATGFDGYEFEHGNVFDLLDAHCVSWRIFAGDDFPFSFILKGANVNRLLGRFRDFDDFASAVNDADFGDSFIFIEPKYGSHDFDIGGPGDFTCGSSMHPLDDVTAGEQLIKSVYETIRNSPHWENSMLIVTFDEHGGFYDHVHPGTAVPPGDIETATYNQNGFRFNRLGVRVPALVISPFTPAGTIDHTVYDHSSMLATLERIFNLGNMTNRDKAASDLLGLLSLPTPRTDAPTSLGPVVTPNPPLNCGDDDKSDQEHLLIRHSELRIAQQSGTYRGKSVREYPIPHGQVAFLTIALLRALDGTEYPDRMQWKADFCTIQTGVDASLFLTEAKLKVQHGIDMKKVAREARQETIRSRKTARG